MTMQSTQLRTVLQASFSKAFQYVDQETTPQIRNISFDLAFRSFEKLFPASRCHAMPVWNSEQLKKYELHILNEGKDIYGEDKPQCQKRYEPSTYRFFSAVYFLKHNKRHNKIDHFFGRFLHTGINPFFCNYIDKRYFRTEQIFLSQIGFSYCFFILLHFLLHS